MVNYAPLTEEGPHAGPNPVATPADEALEKMQRERQETLTHTERPGQAPPSVETFVSRTPDMNNMGYEYTNVQNTYGEQGIPQARATSFDASRYNTKSQDYYMIGNPDSIWSRMQSKRKSLYSLLAYGLVMLMALALHHAIVQYINEYSLDSEMDSWQQRAVVRMGYPAIALLLAWYVKTL